MEKELKIPQRLYKDITQYCERTRQDFESYCLACLRERIALDKYGDLNTKQKKNEKEITKTEGVETKKEEVPPTTTVSKTIGMSELETETLTPEVVCEIPQEKEKELIKTIDKAIVGQEEKVELTENGKKKHRIIQTK